MSRPLLLRSLRSRNTLRWGLTSLILASLGSACWLASSVPVGADESTDGQVAASQAVVEIADPAAEDETSGDEVQRQLHLAANEKRFARLTPEERERLRQFHTQLMAHPDAERLNAVMVQYTEWLSTLPDSQRVALSDLPIKQRIAEIREIRDQENRQHFASLANVGLNSQDARLILKWFEEQISARKAELLQRIQERDKRFRAPPPAFVLRDLFQWIVWGSPDGGGLMELIPPEELSKLVDQLSPQAQELFLSKDLTGQRHQMLHWLRASVVNRFCGPPTQEKLTETLNTLPEEKQRELEELSPQQMRSELTKLYFEQQMQRFSNNRFGGFRRGGKGRSNGPFNDGPGGRREGDGPPDRPMDGEGPRSPGFGPPPHDGPPFGPPPGERRFPPPGPEGPPEDPRGEPIPSERAPGADDERRDG